jgi:uncharacterized membrane protein HdeD (DUF308 family)
MVARGLLAVGLGVVALAWPKMTLAFLIVAFATYAIVDGIVTLSIAIVGPRHEGQRAWAMFLEGIVSLSVGLFVLFGTAMAMRLAFVFIGCWALFTGVMQLVEAPRARPATSSESLLAVSGVVRVIVGVMFLARPHAPLRLAVWLVAFYAFAEGIVLLRMGFSGKTRLLQPA